VRNDYRHQRGGRVSQGSSCKVCRIDRSGTYINPMRLRSCCPVSALDGSESDRLPAPHQDATLFEPQTPRHRLLVSCAAADAILLSETHGRGPATDIPGKRACGNGALCSLKVGMGLRCVATMRFSASFSRTQTGRSGFGGSIRSGRFGDRQRSAEIALGRGYDSADLVIEVGRAGGDPASCAKSERPAVERAHDPPPPATRFPSASANLSGKPSAGQDRGGPAEDTAPRPAQGRLVIPLAMAAYDLVRPPKLLAQAASPPVRLPNNIMINPRDDSFRWVIGISDSPPSPRRTSKVGLQR
jgi:hypothetical protein